MDKFKNIAGLVCIAVISFVLSLLFAELLIRLKNNSMTNYDIEMWKYAKELKIKSDNPLLGHEHIPSKTAVLQSVPIRINEQGLRGGPVSDNGESKRRILFLGGSIALGWGVSEDKVLTSKLEKMMGNAEVLNAGIGNYNAARYVERFLTKLTGLNPTDIVVLYFLRDAERLEAGGGNWLLRNSQLAVTLWTAVNRVFKATGEDVLEKHYVSVYDKNSVGFKEMDDALKRLSTYASKHKIRIYLAMTPDVHNLKNYKFSYVHEIMRETANKYGYTYIDLFPAFKGLAPEEVWAMPGDPHPNALGHEKMAGAIYPVLSSR
ncbi:MAG: SGNH/GDSL hydrolase family protein [Nitrospirae bacterium]|nr:MAG: SGNH/GDSL hydrolase family protein [Nitrospirota bacterium]